MYPFISEIISIYTLFLRQTIPLIINKLGEFMPPLLMLIFDFFSRVAPFGLPLREIGLFLVYGMLLFAVLFILNEKIGKLEAALLNE